MKQEGNEHFRNEKWSQALVTYTSGLGRLPKRPVKERKPMPPPPLNRDSYDPDPDETDEAGPSSKAEKKGVTDGSEKEEVTPEPPLQGLDLECASVRSVLNGNIAACHLRLEEYKAAVDACTEGT